jgi:hypothetical protein
MSKTIIEKVNATMMNSDGTPMKYYVNKFRANTANMISRNAEEFSEGFEEGTKKGKQLAADQTAYQEGLKSESTADTPDNNLAEDNTVSGTGTNSVELVGADQSGG